ncbi:MAG TPA: formyl transferase [Deltaproteobacteria bacterium]|nr:formyl transferase [Deltaproteobacteria bacterium]HIJ41939.1 formyl transferase [Deltaproteobacteria bacterium]
MPLAPLFDPLAAGRPMRVAAFLSGSGTNIRRLIEHREKLATGGRTAPFEIIFLFSDRSDGHCAGEKIALENGLPYFSFDIRSFHAKRSLKRSVGTAEGLAARKEYDRVAKRLVDAFEIDVIALGGYMSYITLEKCVNVHPADLSITLPGGSRKYVGDDAVRDAILAGETRLRSSTLWTDEGVDSGPLLMVSEPLDVHLPVPVEDLVHNEERLLQVVDAHQEELKEIGDWKIFPLTIEMIAEGRFSMDENGKVHVDGSPVPEGFRGSTRA